MTRMSRTFLALPVVVFVLMLPAASALAVETTTGYKQTPNTPTTTTTTASTTTAVSTTTAANTTTGYQQTPTKPASGTGPSKETATPTTSTSPANTAMPHTSTTAHSANSTLPFTGLDLRWIIGAGVLLLAAGLSIRIMQRRQRQDLGR
jgi:cobalamin biosynthesis Mg chelatase CobN